MATLGTVELSTAGSYTRGLKTKTMPCICPFIGRAIVGYKFSVQVWHAMAQNVHMHVDFCSNQ